MSIAERLITTPVNQHAVPDLRPCSVIVKCVCVSRARVHACVISIVSPPVSTDAAERGCTRSNLIRSLSKSKLNPEPAIGQLVQGTLSRQSSSRLRRESTGFSASSLLTEKRRLPVAAGAARLAAGSAQGLVQDVVDPHLVSGGRPRRCRSSSRQIGVCRSRTMRRGRRIRASSDSPGRPC